jgi:hypothetical protein
VLPRGGREAPIPKAARRARSILEEGDELIPAPGGIARAIVGAFVVGIERRVLVLVVKSVGA